MGLNIIAYRVIGIESDEGYGQTIIYAKKEKFKAFDTLRYSGDRDFVLDNEFESHPDDQDLCRPKDFVKATEWINTSDKVPECNKKRLNDLVKAMKADPTIYLLFSW